MNIKDITKIDNIIILNTINDNSKSIIGYKNNILFITPEYTNIYSVLKTLKTIRNKIDLIYLLFYKEETENLEKLLKEYENLAGYEIAHTIIDYKDLVITRN